MVTRARSKLNVKQVTSLNRPGIYSDGAGLYLRVRTSGRSWFYNGRLALSEQMHLLVRVVRAGRCDAAQDETSKPVPLL